MKTSLLRLLILPAMLLGLPTAGIVVAGKSVSQYLEFPPVSRYVEHAPFSWTAFLALATLILACLLVAIHHTSVVRSDPRPSQTSPHASRAFPWWGWLGILLTIVSWVVAWNRFEPLAAIQRHTFTPLWIGFILSINAWTLKRSGHSMMTDRPGLFLALFPASAGFWWFFEYLNRFVQNWHYMNTPFGAWEYVWFATLPFSTVLPAVLGTRDLVLTFPGIYCRLSKLPAIRVRHPKTVAGCALGVSAIGLAGIGIWPNALFPLLWVAPLLIIVSLLELSGKPHLFSGWGRGDWTPTVSAAIAALVCGFFWEMWNYHSLAKWKYTVPFVDRFHLFEMPLLGYAGYLPFGLECAVIGDLLAGLPPIRKLWPQLKPRLCRCVLGTTSVVLGIWLISSRICAQDAGSWYRGESVQQSRLARGVGRWVESDLSRKNFDTGDRQFNGEWLFGTYLMAGFGFGQTAVEHPELRHERLILMEHCIDKILLPEVREFDRESWQSDPIDSLQTDHDHAAYLGYFNLLLSFHRLLDPESKYAALNDKITSALSRRLESSSLLLLATYPGEVYPVDNCAVIGSISLYDRATGADHSQLINRWKQKFIKDYVDSKSGLIIQAVDSRNGKPIDQPRGSGTSLGAYFLSFADLSLSRELFDSVKRELASSWFGFGVVREYPDSAPGGQGDIDSGPVILGVAVSPTGFTLGCARIHGDSELYARIYSTVELFGAPLNQNDRMEFVTGGPLGNAIMFAMLTAQSRVPERRSP